MGRRTLQLVWIAFALLVAALWVRPALAHPHLWITVEARVVYENGGFTGIAQTWSFDEFYSAYAVRGLDANGDGLYDRDELAAITREYHDTLGRASYYTVAELPGETIPFGSSPDFALAVKNDLLTLSFTLPFSSPIPQGTPEFQFSVFDPVYFIAFELISAEFLAAGGSVPVGCNVRVLADSGADALTLPPRGTVPGDLDASLMDPFSSAAVICAAP